MPRQARIEYEGAFYHVMARGDRREPIVQDDRDRSDFVKTLGRACERTGWRIHAWVLMENHYHWLLETPQANLVDGMRWFQNTYTRRFNVRNRLWGHVFGGRYKAIVLDPGDREGGYFAALMDYIHLNPARAGLVHPQDGLGLLDYPWCSLAQGYGAPPSKRPGWLSTQRAFAQFGSRDVAAGRRKFLKRLEQRMLAEAETAGWAELDGQGLQSTLRRGWYWGSQALKERLLERLKGKATSPTGNRDYRLSECGQAFEKEKAERIVRDGLAAAGLAEEDLAALNGSDARRVEIAVQLWNTCTVSQRWIAERLKMRSPGNVSLQLHKWRKAHCKE